MLDITLLVVTVTAYQPKVNQTDSTPWRTSINHRVSQEGIAISQDLLGNKMVCYGDVIEVPGIGYRIVNDVMNPRHRNAVDVWVPNQKAEAKVGVRKRVNIRVIKSVTRCCSKPCKEL